MTFSTGYLEQVDLLLEILPLINEQPCFALKGGTAINLFVRDMPRLSVDIDLTYLPIEPREIFLENMTAEIRVLSKNIKNKKNNRYKVNEIFGKESGQLLKLLVLKDGVSIKIEPNFILRGSVFECEEKALCQKAQDQFLKYTKIKTLSFADIYGGKICAALSRQHPRDLFDIKLLLENEGITEEIRKAFVVYLASNSKPMHEILSPRQNLQEMKQLFEEGFSGMTQISVSFEDLVETQKNLKKHILESLTLNECQFLLSMKNGEADWSMINVNGVDKLPALQWKLINIKKMDKQKQKIAYEKLKAVLNN